MRLQERQHRIEFCLEGGREDRASEMLCQEISLEFRLKALLLAIPGWQALRDNLPSSTPELPLNCPDAPFPSPLPPEVLTEVSPV